MMRTILLTLGALAIGAAAPAAAQHDSHGSGPSSGFAAPQGQFGYGNVYNWGQRWNGPSHRRGYGYAYGYGGGLIVNTVPGQINNSWRSDSFNDWWHDRPDRAYPRWIQNNQNCEQPWYSGGILRC